MADEHSPTFYFIIQMTIHVPIKSVALCPEGWVIEFLKSDSESQILYYTCRR